GLRIELGRPVSRVSWRQGNADVDGLSATALVVSVPPTVLGGLTFDPALEPRKRRAAAAIPVGPVMRVFAQLSKPAESTGSIISVGREGGFWSVGEDLVTAWTGGPPAARFSGVPPLDIALRAQLAFPW